VLEGGEVGAVMRADELVALMRGEIEPGEGSD